MKEEELFAEFFKACQAKQSYAAATEPKGTRCAITGGLDCFPGRCPLWPTVTFAVRILAQATVNLGRVQAGCSGCTGGGCDEAR